jgi:hypothetical protein
VAHQVAHAVLAERERPDGSIRTVRPEIAAPTGGQIWKFPMVASEARPPPSKVSAAGAAAKSI